MRYEEFEVSINDENGVPFPERDRRVEVPHGAHYQVFLYNHLNRRAEAELSIDGKVLGTWRLNPHTPALLKTPTTGGKMFTAFFPDSAEGVTGELYNVPKNLLGLVTVKFFPEVQKIEPMRNVSDDSTLWNQNSPVKSLGIDDIVYRGASRGGSNAEASIRSKGMGTALMGDSNQHYGKVGALERDPNKIVIIHLRIVAPTRRVFETQIPD